MAVTDKISALVKDQFPDFYKEEGENFLAFIQAYYEYLEQNGKMTDAIQNLESYKDIATTTDDFIAYFINQFLPGIPLNVIADKKLLVKYINQGNQARGTLSAYKLLFRALYNEDIEVVFPADQILKVSDGDWNIDRYLVAPYDPNNYAFIGQTVKGTESEAEALVEDITRRAVKGRDVMQIFVSNVRGTFNHLEPVRLKGDIGGTGHAPIVEAGISSVEIITPGGEYAAGDKLELISSLNGDFGKVVVTSTEDLGGTLTFSLVNGGSGYTPSTDPDGTLIEFIGGDGSDPASFQIGSSDIVDTFALSVNLETFASNTLFGIVAPTVTGAKGGDNQTISTFANMVLSSPDYGFREVGETLNSGRDFRDHSGAVLVLANTSDPSVAPNAKLYGVTSGANATVTAVARAYNSTDVVLRIDGYKNFSVSEKVNITTSTGTTVGTVSSFVANTVGIHPVSIGIISGNELSLGDIVAGRSSGTTGIVRHVGTTNGYYNSTLTIANTTDPLIRVGDVLNGETSGANAVVQHIDSVYNEGTDTVQLMIRNYGSSFTSSEKVNLIILDSGDPLRANTQTVGTVDSFSLGGRDLYTYRIGAVNTTDSVTYQANVSTQFDTGPMGRFIADEGIYDVSTDVTVGNVAYSTSNSEIENVYSKLSDAFNFESSALGTIASLSLPIGGSGYSVAPRIRVTEPDIASLGIGEVVLTLQSDDPNWQTGESAFTKLDTTDRVFQSSTGAVGDVKGTGTPNQAINRIQYANGTYEMEVRLFQKFLQREPGEINFANNQTVTLQSITGDYLPGTIDSRKVDYEGTAKVVSVEDRGILGRNAVITSGVGANGTITGVRVLDSGFAYRNREVVIVERTTRPLATSAQLRVNLSGVANAEGYYASTRSHVSSARGFIQDGEFYQEFSYQVQSPLSLDRYRDIALELVHPAGQALFGQFRLQSNAEVDVVVSADNTKKALSNGTIALTEGSFDITGTSTSFLAEYANSGTIIIEYANNAFYTMPLNIVTDDTTANLTIAWANSNISLANAYYTQGNIS